jgi:cell division protease FtsH
MDRGELVNRMTVLLGGRAAEGLIFNEVSTGAGDDLAKATDIARSMVMRFGMDKTLGQVSYETEPTPLMETPGMADWHVRHYGEATAAAIDTAVRALIDDAFQRAVGILTVNRLLLDQSAKELLTRETFSADELKRIAADIEHPGAVVQAALA